MTFRPAALIGIYNHGDTIGAVVEELRARGLACCIVDDGSDRETREVLDELVARANDLYFERLSVNRGKGAALARGFERLEREGYTHALVLDADGQHDTRDVEAFLEVARRHPDALVLGQPLFGADAPKSRLYGRRISQLWVWIETLSLAIGDPLCGYRCYPLAPTNRVLRSDLPGLRMDFDPEIAVRLAWAGAPIANVPTSVRYPPGGISHFRVFRDNARISWMHARLFFGMLARLPALLFTHPVRAIGRGA
jgi:glycosyltransferase involved in cell wall biosynthesis